jgi:hypothetical protein
VRLVEQPSLRAFPFKAKGGRQACSLAFLGVFLRKTAFFLRKITALGNCAKTLRSRVASLYCQ